MPDRRIADARIRRTLARHLRQVLPPEPRKGREEESA
jgi:hypothetical protein